MKMHYFLLCTSNLLLILIAELYYVLAKFWMIEYCHDEKDIKIQSEFDA